ncbi:uncharacterized protein LOC131284476 [Anopheles ziemanni]|uniref:uncharacterized protein LOC131259986 n=1 Tax=Anopheles coustani TaxID=139045 RepID=UPI002659F6A1|nr:uncharacterized protein LOC131259986 [Anopheles coustani]XP_058169319.1 uncharacterized protein LOC131284476 [Anopheles ziemanni]
MKTSDKKSANKTRKNVLVQPLRIKLPKLYDESAELYSLLEPVERKYIVTGTNSVVKLLENSQAVALLIPSTYHPKEFAQILISMARQRNPSILVAVVSWENTFKHPNHMMALTCPNEEVQSPALNGFLLRLKDLLLEQGWCEEQHNVSMPEAATRVKKIDEPMTEEEVSKLYILEPVSGNGAGKRKREDPFKSADFISFSDTDKLITIKSKPTKTRPNQQLIDRKAGKKSYIPLTVNVVQGNPNRQEQMKTKKKKKKLTSQ